MYRIVRVLLLVFLVLLTGALVAAQFYPMRSLTVPEVDRPAGSSPTPDLAQVGGARQVSNDVRAIALLFGHRDPPPPPAPPEPEPVATPESAVPEEPEALPATWVREIGHVVSDDGVRRYLFRLDFDTRVLKLGPGESAAGITLHVVTDDSFEFLRDGTRYILDRVGR